jgi:glycosyltransferase involved in cell wall biosynthesis
LALSRLNVSTQRIADVFFPIIIDTEIFKFNENYRSNISQKNLEKLEKFSFRIFHPSRLMIDKRKALVDAGQWKGNDMLLQGLRVFIDKYAVNDICIMVPDRVYSTDKAMFDAEIERLKLQDNIAWLYGKTNEGFDKQEMVALYSASDLVVDEFGIGWFGSIVVEGAACSKPTMCYIDETGMKKMYPWHPIISTNTPEGIAEKIAKLYFDKEYARQKGEVGRKWAVEFHSHENAGKVYAEQIQKILADIQ